MVAFVIWSSTRTSGARAPNRHQRAFVWRRRRRAMAWATASRVLGGALTRAAPHGPAPIAAASRAAIRAGGPSTSISLRAPDDPRRRRTADGRTPAAPAR